MGKGTRGGKSNSSEKGGQVKSPKKGSSSRKGSSY